MHSLLPYAILTLLALPMVALMLSSLARMSEFEALYELIAIREGRQAELKMTAELADSDNAFEREVRRRIMNDEFEACDDEEIARRATRLASRTRLSYGLFFWYVVAILMIIYFRT